MELSLRYAEQVVIIDIRGKITAGNGTITLHEQFLELLNGDRQEILLNLEQTTYADSFGLAEIVACYKRARERDGAIALLCPPGRVRDLLRVTRLDEVLEIFDKEDEALAAIDRRSRVNGIHAGVLLPRPLPFMI